MNHKFTICSIGVAVFSLLAIVAGTAAREMLKAKTNAGFNQLKSLNGKWEGRNKDGNQCTSPTKSFQTGQL